LNEALWFITFFGIYAILSFVGSWFYKPTRTYSLWFQFFLMAIVGVVIALIEQIVVIEYEIKAIIFAVSFSLITTFFPVKLRNRK
jgi:ABC-type uncharacterized transport system permease subunit